MNAYRTWCKLLVVSLVGTCCNAWLEDLSLRDGSLLEEKAARAIFKGFMGHHSRDYSNDVEELEKRFNIFWDNMKFVADHNGKQKSFEVALNHLADYTRDELHYVAMGLRTSGKKSTTAPLPGPDDEIKARFDPFPRSTPGHSDCSYRLRDVVPPPALDWRAEGVVGPVKDQMGCGSCWAYATTAAVESFWAIKTGNLVTLSEQFPNDCNWMSNPCVGGNMEEGYKFYAANGALALADFPYNDGKLFKECNNSRWFEAPRFEIDTYEMIPEGEEALKKAVAISPVSVGVDASHPEFIFYKSGIFGNIKCNDTEELLTHAITVVGYGEEEGVGYWIVRNQWSDKWGEKGYIRMAMGQGSHVGLCGIARLASRPVMDGELDFHLYSHLPTWAIEARTQVVQNIAAAQAQFNSTKGMDLNVLVSPVELNSGAKGARKMLN